MASLTTRVKFNTPDVGATPGTGDLADENVYYNPNITLFENELVGSLVNALPTPDYDGQVRTVSTSTKGERLTYTAYQGNWYCMGNFSLVGRGTSYIKLNDSFSDPTPNATGVEQFEPNPWNIGITSLSLLDTVTYHFMLMAELRLVTQHFRGFINMFIDPNSSSQPTPTTPGVTKLAFPVTSSASLAAGTPNSSQLCDINYTPPAGSGSAGNLGFSIYLSSLVGSASVTQTAINTTARSTYLQIERQPH